MEQREAFVEAAAQGKMSIAAICREFGISRKTGYKWLDRAAEGESLCDRSRCPHSQPGKTPEEVEAVILAVREENPAWGGRKIKAVLEAAGYENIPSDKTCTNILKRNGMISSEESQKHRPYCRFEKEKCNEMWQTDFKGDFLLGDGTRCYPLTILDDHSRFSIWIEAKSSTTGVKESFTRAFEEYGLPDSVLSDNGAQFAGFKHGYTWPTPIWRSGKQMETNFRSSTEISVLLRSMLSPDLASIATSPDCNPCPFSCVTYLSLDTQVAPTQNRTMEFPSSDFYKYFL